MSKVSIRFYKDHKVCAVWDEEHHHWWFLLRQTSFRAEHSVLDIMGAISQQEDHEKNRNYWKYLKAKLRKESSEVVSANSQPRMERNK